MKTYAGTVDGRQIVLSEDPGPPDGTVVEVQIFLDRKKDESSFRLARCAGALADAWTDLDDQILEELERGRGH